MTKDEDISVVQKHLAGETLDDIYFVVDEPRVIVGDGWIRVPVRPSHEPKHLNRFYGLLADINGEIMDETGENILLLAGDPLEPVEDIPLASNGAR